MTLKKHDIADHLTVAIKDGAANAFPPALGDAVQAFGIDELRDATGYSRQQIRRATRPEAKPWFKTVQDMAHGMNLAIRFVATKNA